jgi:peptidyl-Lys metalloendopeptidase
MLKFFLSLIFLTSNFCFAHTFNDCGQREQTTLIKAANRAKEYAGLVIAETDLGSFIKWMGFNEINDIKQTFTQIFKVLDNEAISFDCFCTFDIYAFSVVQNDYQITICNKFWGAELDGPDSQAGTILHELTHFESIRTSHDHIVNRYECIDAAQTKEGQAIIIENANSYEYLAEDIALKHFRK